MYVYILLFHPLVFFQTRKSAFISTFFLYPKLSKALQMKEKETRGLNVKGLNILAPDVGSKPYKKVSYASLAQIKGGDRTR